MLATLLGASIGVPYVVSRSNQAPQAPGGPNVAATAEKSAWPTWGSVTGQTTPPPPLLPANNANPYAAVPAVPVSYPSTATPAALASLTGLPAANTVRYHSIQEAFRFDLSKEWVYQNWDRKSTGLADTEFFGIRVALITGTQRSDLAGSLTYYFDATGAAQHISFRGRTADTTQLVQYLTQTYQFQRMDALPGEQLYQVRSGSSVFSELRTRPESVLLEEAPQGSFGVVLELGRPGSKRALQPPVPKLEIPPVASPPPTAEAAAGTEAGKAGAVAGKPGSFRAATQAEHNQVFEHRWPN